MIIGLAGKKQSGKSSVATYLIETHGFVDYSWAFPIKEIIGKQIFGLTDEQMYGPESIKEKTLKEWGMSPRKILQLIGTDMFRRLIREDMWVYLGLKNITKLQAAGYNIVIPDCRFPNELKAVKDLGGEVGRVIRIGQESEDAHESETALDLYEDWDVEFSAVLGDLPGLYFQADCYLAEKIKEETDAI